MNKINTFFLKGSKSQSALWNAITAGMGIKEKEQKDLLSDPRSPEEILAEDPPASDEPEATEKTAIRFDAVSRSQCKGQHVFDHLQFNRNRSVRLP